MPPAEHLFYNEAICDPKFFQKLYNTNYYIGKRVKVLKHLIEYYKDIEHFFYNNKKTFYDYLDQIKILKWDFMAEMIDCEIVFTSEYDIWKSDNNKHYFYDKFIEYLATQMNDKDFNHVLNRV